MLPRSLRFEVEGAEVVGALHLPPGPGPHPAVIVGGPMTSVKEQVSGVHAAALARRGIAALAIDPRGFGESGGAPRQYEHAGRKIADLRAALEALAAQPGVDPLRLGAAGVCLGAGYAAHAAALEPRVRAFAAVAGYFRDPAELRAQDPSAFDGRVAQGRAARLRFEETGEVLLIPAAALHGDAGMQSVDTVDYYTRRAAVPGYTNALAVMSREHFLPFDVQAAAPLLRAPTLLVHSENALSPRWARRFFDAIPAEKELVWVESRGQTDFYDDLALVEPTSDRLAAWFLRHL